MDQHRPSFPNPGNNRYPAFFSSPNPHHNHHQHHLPPPPNLPPPPPRPLHQSSISLAPQPLPPNSFHHHHGHSPYQFVNPPQRVRYQQPTDPNIVNHHRDNNHNLGNRYVDFVQAPRRASERPVVVDRRRDRPIPVYRGHDGDPGGPAVWEPSPRVLIDSTPPPPPITRRVPRVYIEQEHSPYRPTYQPVDRFRNDQDGGSRVRKVGNSDIWIRVDELPRERRVDLSRNGNFHHDRSQRDVDRDIHRSVTVEHFSRSVPQKEQIMQGRDDGVNGYITWESLPRGAPHSPTEKRNRATDGGNRFYEKGKNHVLESEERFEDRDRWEDAQDYNITPSKKQKKKKNVMLRIQPALPSYSNDCEHSPSGCKDREPSQIPDLRLSIKEREGSPIVSFKSNLLIVASSSATAVAEDVSDHRDDKNRNESDNKDNLLLPNDVAEKVLMKSSCDNECEKGPSKPKSPTYLKKVKSFVSQYLPADNSGAPSHRTESLSEGKEPSKSPSGKVLNKSYAAPGSSKENSPSSSRKRKNTNPHTPLSSSQNLVKDLGSVSVDNLVNSLCSESLFDEGVKDSGKGLTTDVKAAESSEVGLTAVEPSKAVDGESAKDSVSAGASAPKKKRRRVRKRRACPPGQLSSNCIEIQVNDIGTTKDVQRPSSCDGIINTFQKGSGSNTAINYSNNLCLDVVPVPLQHVFAEGSSDVTFSSRGCTNVLPAIDSMNSSEKPPSLSRTGGVDSASLEEGEIEESLDANPSEQDNKCTQVSVSKEFFVSEVSNCKTAIMGTADTVVPQSSGQSIDESEMMEGDLSLFPGEGSRTKYVRKRKISELDRGTGKEFDALSLTLGCPTDSNFAQHNIAGSGFISPDTQLELHIRDSITTNECESYPAEVITPSCNKKNKLVAPELGSALGTSTEVACPDSLLIDEEVSEFAIQSDINNLDLKNDESAQISAGVKLADDEQTSTLSESVRCLQGYDTFLMNDGSLQNQHTDQNTDRPETPILNEDHNLLVRDSGCDINIAVNGDLSILSDHQMFFTESASDEKVINSPPTINTLSENIPAQRKGLLSSLYNTTPTGSSMKSMPLLRATQTSKGLLQNSSNSRKKQARTKNKVNLASRLSYGPSGKRRTTVIQSRTWHRTDNNNPNPILPVQNSITTSVPLMKLHNNSPSVWTQSNSYVRKGKNSLFRNPVTAVTQPPKIPAPAPALAPATSPCEVPVNLSSLPCNTDSSNCNLAPMVASRFSPVADSTMATENEPEGSSVSSEFETKSLEDQSSLNHSRKMVYIKRKSNQLVAATNPSTETSASNKDLPALMSDVYFKSTKNQLVRATPETTQAITDPIDEGRRVFTSYATKRVSMKIPKSRKLSLVWKLCNTLSPKKGVNSLRCQQVLPHLLPWKRATYRKNLVRKSADFFKSSPLSHKLLSSRKMHIMYKRSGLSLRRSKVVSLQGSSLKWSISLERRSKKVDKEATSAVAMLKKDEEKSSSYLICSGIQSKNNSLHKEQSRPGSGHLVKRRLLIRNDEYVRNGNGNQLIRNPKRRTRMLASEKVRWSLHTARMRLAKKRKYCQFFTRFGKCNKEEGKCSYIHDPSKTAVCTKFLNGLCSDPKCKLTHQVIPERMPDCSFFLHGLCSNQSCPYRHVSVNPKATICESFLKGYCADGNECRKKHSYMCPVYESSGDCPEGSKCKLYHPKKSKDKKKTKNSKRRYFGPKHPALSNETESEGYRKRAERKEDGVNLEDGAFGDYISLDLSEEEGEQEDEGSREIDMSQQSVVVDDDDELIKPFRLLRMMSQAAQGLA